MPAKKKVENEKSKEDKPVVKSIVRINYPEATSIYEYYSDIDATISKWTTTSAMLIRSNT